MRILLALVLGPVFFYVAIQALFYRSSTNIYYLFLISLSQYFIISHIIYSAIFYVVARLYMICVYEGDALDDENKSFGFTKDGEIDNVIMGFFAVFLIMSTFVGFHLSKNFQSNCFTFLDMCASPRVMSFFGGLLYGLSGIISVFYMLIFIFGMGALGAAIGMTIPAFVAGLIAFSDGNNFRSAIERTLERDRPDRAIAQQLARIMKENMINDRQVEELVSQLSPLQQWVARVRYRKRMRDARRLNEMMEAKVQALRAEGDLSQTVHEMDGVRRERDEHGGWR